MVVLIVFTALVGMLLAVPGQPDIIKVNFACIGIGLCAAAGAVINHVVDRQKDA